MPDLTAAHRGYEYQDLLVACRLVDMLLGAVVEVRVDEKLVPGDRFDDLTTLHSDGSRERVQFKHTDNDDRPLTAATFTNDKRGLRLDCLFATMLADRDGPGSDVARNTYRVVLRDKLPTNSDLTAVLKRPVDDPGPFLPTLPTVRLAFNPDVLWAQIEQRMAGAPASDRGLFPFLGGEAMPLSYSDLDWACSNLVIEVAAPAASRDLTSPGAAEELILKRVRQDVGAGSFPNESRDPVDVAAAMIDIARYARQGSHTVSAEETFRRANLQTDFGAVARKHPVDPEIQVPRPTEAQRIIAKAAELAAAGGTLLAVGPPGQGKSWLCQQVKEDLSAQGWLVAEHYCYLGDADHERSERVLAERVFGSLVGRLASADPSLVEGQRPLLAADEFTLVNCLARSFELKPQRPIALVIDGVDHVTRVRAGHSGGFDPSWGLAESLASLEMPDGSVLVVLSQPGAHLEPLENAGGETVHVKGLDQAEVRLLAEKHEVIPAHDATARATGKAQIEDEIEIAEFLEALEGKSAGNALYATYLCREASRSEATLAKAAETVRALPHYDESLESYYAHLYSTLDSGGWWVAEVISLVDFAVTRSELGSIRPDVAHRIDEALEVLAPVLDERAAQGGVRVYHESFARYLRRLFRDNPAARDELMYRITAWLQEQGMFDDSRAFRSLLPLLAEAERDTEVVAIVDRGFVIRAVASGFPASGIIANLATAIRCAARLGQWPLVVRYVEMSRAAESYEAERLSSILVEFADVPVTLLGASVVAERLLHDGHMVMTARDGIQMCAALDALGAVAPWKEYMTGYIRESETDNTSYGVESERVVSLAWLRGRLRLAKADSGAEADPEAHDGIVEVATSSAPKSRRQVDSWQPIDLVSPVDWHRIAIWVEQQELPGRDVVAAIDDTRGINEVPRLISHLSQPGAMCLALAEYLEGHPSPPELGDAREWVSAAVDHGLPPGSLHVALSIDAGILDEIDLLAADFPGRLLELAQRVQQRSVSRDGEDLGTWLDACAAAANQDPLALNAAEATISGEGWYKCWLRFTIALVRAEAADYTNRAELALEALHCLQEDVDPFAGDPRACDLYFIHPTIRATIQRAMALVDDALWAEAIRLLYEISNSITVTIRGEVGGPLTPDLVLQIAVESSSGARQAVASELLEEQIGNESARRYYSNLAEYQLLGAQLAIISGGHDEALQFWHRACQMLTSYGWRKDITIFELLDPLPKLIAADRRQGQECVSRVQPLCERIPFHTDLSETRRAWSRWWYLLGLADPVALAHLVAPRLLGNCNQPDWLLHGALVGLWSLWCERADPFTAGTLRLTLDVPLHSEDPDAFSRLVNLTETDHAGAELANWLLGRADERPISYGASNSDDLLAIDDRVIADINAVTETANLPAIFKLRQDLFEPVDQPDLGDSHLDSNTRSELEQVDPLASLPPGLAGLAHAIRSWRERPYDTEHALWSVDRFADAIDGRLLELVDSGREHDAASALVSLANACEFGRGTELLRELAKGLDQHGSTRLAVTAHTLVWTRTRGQGGWLNFAGEVEVQSLSRATEIDSALVLEVIAEETERAVFSRRYGTYGICQALIQAFCAGALTVPGKESMDVAFEIWDEAFEVISDRAPRVHESEDPEDPYIPACSVDCEFSQNDLDGAFALGALASLAHPGREKKRRSLLAARLLLSERPALAAAALDIALSALSEPATIMWLLRLIEASEGEKEPVVSACRQTLTRLATGRHLVVRVLARRVLGEDAPHLPPPDPADPQLLGRRDQGFWTPRGSDQIENGELPGLDGLVRSVAGDRLSWAEPMLPGLSESVRSRVAVATTTEHFHDAYKAQLREYADQSGRRSPDAYLMAEQIVEEALQLAAAGGRAAQIAVGDAALDPAAWEDDLAEQLLDDPALPLAVEARRIPRPPIPVPPLPGSSVWVEVGNPSSAAVAGGPHDPLHEPDGLLLTTLQVEPIEAVWVVEQGPFRDWRMIASVEQHTVRHPDWDERSDFVIDRYRAVELRNADDSHNLDMPPAALGDIRMWMTEVHRPPEVRLPDQSLPLVGVDIDIVGAGDGLHGLGVQSPLLVPTSALVAVLDLQPGDPFTLNDEHGCGLVLVTWRAGYDTSDYYLTRPRLVGSGLLARPDLFERLQGEVGDRLVLRDFAARSEIEVS
ncbi:MAG: ATP-binding protein [Acidimicrobiia bacterium]|nr:ATP-binding protein [Acidimicrobiia bacterium]MYE73543.1 ATP-binding protein [Acidimicrobiia bacterium]MYJ62564.1 ATP-binding protein [Acidimicrobiia bacterium]